MRTSVLSTVLVVGLVGIACSDDTTAPATGFHATLTGAQEVPAITTTGAGTATFDLNAAGDSLSYTITITSPVSDSTRQAHIHLANAGASGNISVWLCGSTANPGPGGTPSCALGTSNGVLITGSVAVPAATVTAMRGFGAYVNVHTKTNTGGEIRGQIVPDAP